MALFWRDCHPSTIANVRLNGTKKVAHEVRVRPNQNRNGERTIPPAVKSVERAQNAPTTTNRIAKSTIRDFGPPIFLVKACVSSAGGRVIINGPAAIRTHSGINSGARSSCHASHATTTVAIYAARYFIAERYKPAAQGDQPETLDCRRMPPRAVLPRVGRAPGWGLHPVNMTVWQLGQTPFFLTRSAM